MLDANRLFPVVKNVSIPVRGLFVLMILFVLVIGPVNLYVLGRKKRKIWLLWTVPAISFVTCIFVFGYMIVVEGWSGHARTEGVTILDEVSHRATTIGWAGYYSPLTPGDGLHFDSITELTPQLFEEHEYYRRQSSSTRTLDWTNDQHLASGWVSARIPAHFALRKSETRRERVTVRRGKGGSLTMVNALGADIERFWLADKAGKIYTAANIPAGGEALLAHQEDSARAGGSVETLRTLLGTEWVEHYKRVTDRPAEYLRPGCYLAALESSPFIEDALKGSHRQGRAAIYGIMREPGDAD
jgi:hypothetical protein